MMARTATATPGCPRLAAPDRHAPKAAVALPLSTFVARRPTSAMHRHTAARAQESTI